MEENRKFKVGDKVRIREDLITNNTYNGCYFVESMEKYKGQITTIVSFDKYVYELDIDNGCWSWSDGMLTQVNFTKDDLQEGDIVTLRNGDRLIYTDDNFTDLKDSKQDNSLTELSDLNTDLTFDYRECKENDIVKVERPTSYTTMFERQNEIKKMTVAEICEELGYDIEIIKEEN